MSHIEPYEATRVPWDMTDTEAEALREVLTAVNGFVYTGISSAAVIAALAWLREHPAHVKALGLKAPAKWSKAPQDDSEYW
jgi:hypothetical protein